MKKITEFCQKLQVTELALFGSVLRDDFRPDSNIDVRVKFHPDAHPQFSTRLDRHILNGGLRRISRSLSQHRFKPPNPPYRTIGLATG
ncbi:MAG: nucleotidyltransferase family protein, partial [Limnospira sp.]